MASDEENPIIAELRERVARLETGFDWMKEILKRIENRTWWILGSVVALGLIAILIAILK